MSFKLRRQGPVLRISASAEDWESVHRALERLRASLARREYPLAEGPGPGAAFADEPALRDELAGVLDASVAEQKFDQTEAFERTLREREGARGTIRVPLDGVDRWLACLNDLRLMLAAELHIDHGWPTPLPANRSDPRIPDWMLFHHLTELEVDILDGLLDR